MTLSQAVFPRSTILVDIILVLVGSAVVAGFAQLTIPIQPVPITGQTFAVLLVGTALGSRRGALALLAYLAEGLAGAPVFANGSSAWTPDRTFGEPTIVGSSAGYLIGFVLAAFVVGWLAEHGRMDRAPWSTVLMLLAGEVLLYVPGLIWLDVWIITHNLGISPIDAGLLPFLVGDTIKLLAAAVLVPSAWDLVRKTRGLG